MVATSQVSGKTQFWLFEPANPTPKAAPVIVFSHGWGGVDPAPYRAWIDHIIAIPCRQFAALLASGSKKSGRLLC